MFSKLRLLLFDPKLYSLKLQETAPPAKREVDVAAHHLVATHLEKFVDVSTKPQDFTTFGELSKLKNVKTFITEKAPSALSAYGWGTGESDFKTAVITKAEELLAPPVWGKRTMGTVMPAAIICGMLLLIGLLMLISGVAGVFSTFFVMFFILAIIWGAILFFWVPPSAIFDGRCMRAAERYSAGNASDPVLAVSDLAALEQWKSVEALDHRGRLPSLDYWRPIAKVSNGVAAVPVAATATAVRPRELFNHPVNMASCSNTKSCRSVADLDSRVFHHVWVTLAISSWNAWCLSIVRIGDTWQPCPIPLASHKRLVATCADIFIREATSCVRLWHALKPHHEHSTDAGSNRFSSCTCTIQHQQQPSLR